MQQPIKSFLTAFILLLAFQTAAFAKPVEVVDRYCLLFPFSKACQSHSISQQKYESFSYKLIKAWIVAHFFPGIDQDNDGYKACATISTIGCDCNDNNNAIHPGATEIWYDGVDQNCDGANDFDQDKDGFTQDVDCNDTVAAINPDAIEIWYDGIDQNCDQANDFDQDKDGFSQDVDCNDAVAAINPDATEIWYDGVDQNCDQANDFDQDGDGFTQDVDCNDTVAAINPDATEIWYDGIDQNCDQANDFDQDGDGQVKGEDCNDTLNTIYSGAPDLYGNSVDENCDGMDGVDSDEDGYASEESGGTDCDDSDKYTYPNAPEYFDGKDNNCDESKALNIATDTAVFEGPEESDHRVAMGDVNGDGYTDIIVADPSHSVEPYYEEGMVYILFGDGNTTFGDHYAIENADVKIRGGCGWNIGTILHVDDLDGDGIDDVMMVAGYDNGEGGGTCGDGTGTYNGGVFVMYGRTNDQWLPHYDFTATYSGTNLEDLESLQAVGLYDAGFKIETTQDLDGDGKKELMISSMKKIYIIPQESSAIDKRYHGLVNISQETTNRGHLIWDSTTDGLGNPSSIGDLFSTGDFNGDGLTDITTVNTAFDNRFWVLYGQNNFPDVIDVNNISSLQQVQYRILRPNPVGLGHGISGHIFGDVSPSGKKIDDLLIHSGFTVNGNSQAGRIFIVPGKTLSEMPQGSDFNLVDDILNMNGVIVNGTDENGHFGLWMHTSDMDGDGQDDLLAHNQYFNSIFRVMQLFTGINLTNHQGQIIDANMSDEYIHGNDSIVIFGQGSYSGDLNNDGSSDLILSGLAGQDISLFARPTN